MNDKPYQAAMRVLFERTELPESHYAAFLEGALAALEIEKAALADSRERLNTILNSSCTDSIIKACE